MRNLKAPPQGQATWWDDSVPGFNCRVSQGGTKTFTLVHGGKRTRITIGRYPTVSLADAREAARRILAEKTLRQPQPRLKAVTFGEAMHVYLQTHCAKHNRASTNLEIKRLLSRHFLPRFDKRDLAEITVHDVSAIIDGLLDTPSEANHAFSVIRALMRFAVRRQYIAQSPCDALQRPARAVSRDRALSDYECAEVLRTATEYGYSFGTIVQLLLLTGQRRVEIASLRWSYIDETNHTITLPGSLTKNHREHTFPYGERVAAILADVPRMGDYLFPARGHVDVPFSGWSKSKPRFDRRCAIEHWTLHDLRRTFATQLAGLGVQPHVIERHLNHASGQISGIAAVYNRYSYLAEMRDAIARYDQHVTRLCTPQSR